MIPMTIKVMEPHTKQRFHFAASVLNNPVLLGLMSFGLIGVPIMGMWAVHKYNWQHWAPFDKPHRK
jgi:hypothetical protein